MFRSVRSEPSGFGWSTDYPFGEIKFLTRSADFTKVHVSRDAAAASITGGAINDDQLFECPILVGSDVGTAGLSDNRGEVPVARTD